MCAMACKSADLRSLAGFCTDSWTCEGCAKICVYTSECVQPSPERMRQAHIGWEVNVACSTRVVGH